MRQSNNHIPNTLVIDHKEGIHREYIEEPKGGKWNLEGGKVYLMAKVYKETGTELIAVEPDDVIHVLPEKLYRAIHWKREAKPLFSNQPSLLDKINTGLTIFLVIALLLFIFIIFSSLTGG